MTNDAERVSDSPKRIYLSPNCGDDDRTWCEDDQGPCDECGAPSVEYVRADIIEAQSKALAEATTYGLLLVHQLRVVQANAARNGEFFYHPKSPIADTISALDAALTPTPENPNG